MNRPGHPRTGGWTVGEVLDLPEDTHHRVELLGGTLLLSPRESVPHQRAAGRLAVLLGAAATAPFEVLEAVNVLVPDGLLIPDLVVADAAAAAEAGATLHADDVVVAIEIASPSTRVIDRRTKPGLYAAAGIPHYWRLDLDPAPRLHLGRLAPDGSGYLDRTVPPGGSTALTEPFPLDLDPAALRR
ncbi:Uma2 family endonuclease [Kitasatospora sp. NPDC057198]|uniref:Uma2 family endonuclease n=1 Tax=Kitasatospora sp. NPDC057198 TaxID=3346046 RepID=UPI003631623E